ncbi:MAG: Chitinase class [Geobacteraceae bacterium]|nr:MAG: Chitinase class [Geobacteraceae bacterium]
MQKIDKEKFLFLYVNEYGELKESQRDGILFLLSKLCGDSLIIDIRHAAYMLATVKHECAGRWQPIEEFDKGAGRKYGKPAANGKTFYGRGYVQLTWAENYQTMGQALGIDLYNHPEMACTPDVAYKIMSRGMRKGSFTGVKLLTYIDGEKCDYHNARKIINGLDCAEKIAGYAQKIEAMLNQSREVTA